MALDRVCLTIRKGESVGIMGVNGAGKSTMLELIAGTTVTTAGSIAVRGSVAALLELGAGFNPAWTGRQNVAFQARIAGVRKEERAAHMAAVQAFADVGAFFEQPMRMYSTGMFLRVAFAAAITSDPDILIVDEALAVGDAKFQTKCFARIESFRNAGRTVVFVTHAPEVVSRLCTRGVILDRGRVTFDGNPAEATRRYLAALYGPDEGAANAVDEVALPLAAAAAPGGRVEDRAFYNPHERRTGDRRAVITDVSFTSGRSERTNVVRAGDEVRLAVRVSVDRDVPRPTVGLVVRTVDNVAIYGSSSAMQGRDWGPLEAGSRAIAHVGFNARLVPGEYFLDIGLGDVVDGRQEAVDFRLAVIHFFVTGDATAFGLCDLDGHFELAGT
jgi:lipopolysaccharide transport system ATP-binding protein